MFKFWTDKDGTAHYQGSFRKAEIMDDAVASIIRREITDQVVPAWIEKYGAELLDKITPEEVEKAIKQAVAEKVLK